MDINAPMLDWNAPGSTPPQSLRDTGWQAGDKPAAGHFNALFYIISNILDEIKAEGASEAWVTQQIEQITIALVDSYTSTSKTQAPTADALRLGLDIKQDKLRQADNFASASKLINDTTAPVYPDGVSMFKVTSAAGGWPAANGYVLTFRAGSGGYQIFYEMYTGTTQTDKTARQWTRSKRDSNAFWQAWAQTMTEADIEDSFTSTSKTKVPPADALRRGLATKLDLAGGDMTGAIKRTYNPNAKHYQNLAAYYATAVTTGAIKINLPRSFLGTFVDLVIRGYDYGVGKGAWELRLAANAATANTGTWVGVNTAILEGDAPFATVTLGADGTNACIILGGVTTTWSFTNIEIAELTATNSGTDNWETGWNISLISDISGITKAVQPTLQKLATQAYADSVLTSAKADSTVKASQAEANAKLYADSKLALKMDADRASNQLPNGGFAAGLTGWNAIGAKASVWKAEPSGVSYPGELHFSESASAFEYVESDLIVVANNTPYTMSALMVPSGVTNSSQMYIEAVSETGEVLGNAYAQVGAGWHQRSFTFTTPATRKIRVRCVIGPGAPTGYKGFAKVALNNGTVALPFNTDTDARALFQSVVNGKASLEPPIIGKGGTVSKAGSVATFAELAAGINSIVTKQYARFDYGTLQAGNTRSPSFGFIPRIIVVYGIDPAAGGNSVAVGSFLSNDSRITDMSSSSSLYMNARTTTATSATIGVQGNSSQITGVIVEAWA